MSKRPATTTANTAQQQQQQHRELLIADLENELSQLQSEWAAVTEYCAELQQQQSDLAQDLSSNELEERLLTKKLQEILGTAVFETDEATANDDAKKEEHGGIAYRALSTAERENVLQSFFESTSPSQQQSQSYQDAEAANFVCETGSAEMTTEATTDPSKLSISSAASVNVSPLLLQEIVAKAQEAAEVSMVLQRQREMLNARLQQCGAVSVALDAMLLYRQPAVIV